MRSKMVEAKVHRKGGTVSLSVSQKEVKDLHLAENEKVQIEIHKKDTRLKSNPLEELWGSGLISRPTKQVLKEARENFSKWGL